LNLRLKITALTLGSLICIIELSFFVHYVLPNGITLDPIHQFGVVKRPLTHNSGCYRMVVRTCSDEVYSIQHHVIIVCLWLATGWWFLPCTPLIKLTCCLNWSGIKHHKTNQSISQYTNVPHRLSEFILYRRGGILTVRI
jgi:hypothetical protein